MKLFELKEKKVEINMQILVVPELHALLYYESKHKQKGFDPDSIGYKAIIYLGLYHDFDSPYHSLAPDAKRLELTRICFEQGEHKTQKIRIEGLFNSKEFKEADYKIRELIQMPEERTLDIFLNKLDEIQNWIQGVNVNEENIKIVFDAMEKLPKNFKILEELKNSIRERKGSGSGNTFGGRELSFLEKQGAVNMDEKPENYE